MNLMQQRDSEQKTRAGKRRNRAVFRRTEGATGFARGARELAAVEDVGRYHILLGSQLLALHWPRPGQRRHGERRLRELYHHGWLDRVPLYNQLGPPRALYLLGHLGRVHCAQQLGVGVHAFGPQPAREREHGLLFIEHHLFSVECMITLRLACEAIGGGVVHFQDERSLRAINLRNRSTLPTVPDSFVVLNAAGRIQSFCLEADRGTVDLRAWRRKVQGYARWSQTRPYRETYRNPAVLTVIDSAACPAERRLHGLKTAAEEESNSVGADPSMFWFTTSDLLTVASVLFAPIWQVGALTAQMPLLTEGM